MTSILKSHNISPGVLHYPLSLRGHSLSRQLRNVFDLDDKLQGFLNSHRALLKYKRNRLYIDIRNANARNTQNFPYVVKTT